MNRQGLYNATLNLLLDRKEEITKQMFDVKYSVVHYNKQKYVNKLILTFLDKDEIIEGYESTEIIEFKNRLLNSFESTMEYLLLIHEM